MQMTDKTSDWTDVLDLKRSATLKNLSRGISCYRLVNALDKRAQSFVLRFSRRMRLDEIKLDYHQLD